MCELLKTGRKIISEAQIRSLFLQEIQETMITRLLFAIVCLTGTVVAAQSVANGNRVFYINQYYLLAMEEMSRSGVPASITLAQGALESGDGMSRLALQANNHFGIKCHDDWNGKTIKHDDDRNNECFRKYTSVEESYRDHSDFLSTKQRYAFLFELEPTNYKAWAKGLKNAGYATSRNYDNALIRIIEEYNLQQYDLLVMNSSGAGRLAGFSSAAMSGREVLENNRVKYIITKAGDTFKSLSAEFDKLEWELPRYNDLTPYDSIGDGQMLYIQPKRNKAKAGSKTHLVKQGETIYGISQLYAIKLERLHDLNHLPYEAEPEIGTVLQLRKPLKGTSVTPVAADPLHEETDEVELQFELDL